MFSVITNLVTSLEFQPVRCTTTLFQFGGTRNDYVANRFLLFSITAESSATSGYIVAPERSAEREARAVRNVERTKRKPNFVPFVLCTLNYFSKAFCYFPLMKTSLIFCLCYYLMCPFFFSVERWI